MVAMSIPTAPPASHWLAYRKLGLDILLLCYIASWKLVVSVSSIHERKNTSLLARIHTTTWYLPGSVDFGIFALHHSRTIFYDSVAL